MSSSVNRTSGSAIVSLYRQCLRSVRRIPSPEQQAVYDEYVRDGFRQKRSYPDGSKPAEDARRDAEEQLERMNYYLAIQESEAARKKTRGLMGGGGGVDSSSSAPTAATVTSKKSLAKVDGGGSEESSRRAAAVRSWLSSAVPHLYPEDVESYAVTLVDDGFDSVKMIESELESDDLDFMKKAHQRAVLRALNMPRGE